MLSHQRCCHHQIYWTNQSYLMFQRNNSLETDGYMEVSTGQLSGTLPGQILRWNYEDHIPYYEGECAKVSNIFFNSSTIKAQLILLRI